MPANQTSSSTRGNGGVVSEQEARRIIQTMIRQTKGGANERDSDNGGADADREAHDNARSLRAIVQRGLDRLGGGETPGGQRAHGASDGPHQGSRRAKAGSGGQHAQTGLTRSDVEALVRSELARMDAARGSNSSSSATGREPSEAKNASKTKAVNAQEAERIIRQELRAKATAGQSSRGSPSSSGGQADPGSRQAMTANQVRAMVRTKARKARASSDPQGASPSSPASHGSGSSSATRPSAAGPGAKSPPSAQTVASVLTNAQWQLSEELESNLKQLRQVINQSQEVARKIEQVLGHGTRSS